MLSSSAIALAISTMEAKAQLTVTPVNVTPINVAPINVTPIDVTPIDVTPPTVEPPIVEPPTVEPPSNGGTVAVPEPSTIGGLLVISTLAGGLLWQRRKLPTS
jgi:PEP-CTERM motif